MDQDTMSDQVIGEGIFSDLKLIADSTEIDEQDVQVPIYWKSKNAGYINLNIKIKTEKQLKEQQ